MSAIYRRIMTKLAPVDSRGDALHIFFWVDGHRTNRSAANGRPTSASRAPSFALRTRLVILRPNSVSHVIKPKRFSIKLELMNRLLLEKTPVDENRRGRIVFNWLSLIRWQVSRQFPFFHRPEIENCLGIEKIWPVEGVKSAGGGYLIGQFYW